MIEPFDVTHLAGFKPTDYFKDKDWYSELQAQADKGLAWSLRQDDVTHGFVGFVDYNDKTAVVWAVLGTKFDKWSARSLKQLILDVIEQRVYRNLIMFVESNYLAGVRLAQFLGFKERGTGHPFGVWVRE